jgi:hydroxymethylglutaryl-CoA lyase
VRPFDQLPKKVRVRDTTLRDGLQSRPEILPTSSKVEIYGALVSAGIRELQITSFVNPNRVPQLADAEEFWDAVLARPEHKSALVANARGFMRAIAAGVSEVEAVVSLSDTFNLRNVQRTTLQSLDEITALQSRSAETGCVVSVALSNCFHCVFEGQVEQHKVNEAINQLSLIGIRQISICDTTGYATPDQVYRVMSSARAQFPGIVFGAHLHDTRGRALVNAMAAFHAGIDWVDAAVAGLGGCPFAPGMGGNLSLEMLVDTLTAMNVETGIDIERIFAIGELIRKSISQAQRPSLAEMEMPRT